MLSRLFGGGTTATTPAPRQAPTEPEEPQTPASNYALAKGSLYASDKSGKQQCVYITCEAAVRGTADPFRRELVVSNVDTEDNDSNWPLDIGFSVTNALRLEVDGLRFGWSDRSGRRFNFDCEDEGEASELKRELLRGMWEVRNGRGAQGATEGELESFLRGRDGGVDGSVVKPTDLLEAAGELIRLGGDFYKYDGKKEIFEMLSKGVTVTLNSAKVTEDGSRAYLVMIFDGKGKNIFQQEIDDDMGAEFVSSELSMIWIMTTPDDDVIDPKDRVCLSVKFENPPAFVRFRNQYSVCLYEIKNEGDFEDLKQEDQRYVENSTRDDVEFMEIDSEVDQEEEQEEKTLGEEKRGPRSSLVEDDESDTDENSQLAVAYNNDRTFVLRGSKMGVFKTGEEDVAFRDVLRMKDPSKPGTFIKPSKIMLHDQDTSMLLLDSTDDSKVMRMDLNRGEIVETWKGAGSQPFSSIHRAEKYSNMTPMQEFVGLNKNQLMRMDPRTRDFVVQSKRYAAGTKTNFQSMATTGSGHIVAASATGDLRLYDTIGKNAKTHLPGLGDPIIGTDVTEDGRFVLATTAKYLLIVDTRVSGQQKSGFLKSMGKNKPAPVKLTITPRDVVRYRMGAINFTPAHFNTGSSLERSIVTSTGPFIVTWNFRAVKQGRLDCYQVKRYRDNVVADEFAYNDDGKIVVTLPNDVTLNGLRRR